MNKKLFCFLLMITIVHAFAFAQNKPKNATWGSHGAIAASIGYGFLNISKLTLFDFAFNFDKEKITSTGPVVLAGEYGVGHRFGIGVQVGFGKIKGVFTQKGILPGGGDYIETSTLNSFQVIVRGNYHWGSSEKFDPYVGLGLGMGNSTLKSTNNSSNRITNIGTVSEPSNIGYTVAAGLRYYFSQRIGFYGEAGYMNGSLLQLGLVGRF